ncbi:hypothetical protein G9A89_016131 [Geosiphon pyriformis]|nr:hypothetical protein G9A89_016131 [Geosiphon pyriformis]
MDIAIELVQKIKDNQRMYLEFTLPVFASAFAMTPAPQMTAASFAVQIQGPNKQLINRFTANLVWLLELLAQTVKENQQSQKPRFEPHFNQPQQLLYQKQQNCGPPVCYHCGLTGHFSRDCAPPKSENASQPEKNSFYAFNLTDNDHNMDELAINTSESTRKKKKTKIDFVLDPNKASKLSADNNEPPKTKVFKNSPKLKSSEIVQKSGSYSVVENLMEASTHITFGQLMTHPQFRKNLYKLLILKKKTPKTNKCSYQAKLADNNNIIPLICKVQVAGYFIDLILDSESSVSIIAKHFLEAIGIKINEPSTRPITNIHGDKKKALLDYELCALTIRYDEKPIVVKCHYWTTSLVTKQNQEKEQSDESDNDESDDKKNQEKQEKTAELVYTIFTSNNKPLNNVKADKKGIIVNSKLICWSYYNIFKRTFDKKLSKKAKYSYWWHGSCT